MTACIQSSGSAGLEANRESQDENRAGHHTLAYKDLWGSKSLENSKNFRNDPNIHS